MWAENKLAHFLEGATKKDMKALESASRVSERLIFDKNANLGCNRGPRKRENGSISIDGERSHAES